MIILPLSKCFLALGSGSHDAESGSTTTFISLKESIKTNKGIVNPIIVNKIDSDKYVVIEGNTRVAIYRDFRENGVSGDWDSIPALIYENIPESYQDAIRLQAHLVGPRAWDPYSKAKYLHELRSAKNLTWNQVVDYCGGEIKGNLRIMWQPMKIWKNIIEKK